MSLMTRANGHFKHFYSVAQHSISCCREAKARGYSERVQLGCLLHDASESYISDMTRPVKQHFPEYKVIEKRLQNSIFEKYGLGDLSDSERNQIHEIDDALLYYEFVALMAFRMFDEKPALAADHDFSQRDFVSVEREFIKIFSHLTAGKEGFGSLGIDGCG